jgi:hypothetical protein
MSSFSSFAFEARRNDDLYDPQNSTFGLVADLNARKKYGPIIILDTSDEESSDESMVIDSESDSEIEEINVDTLALLASRFGTVDPSRSVSDGHALYSPFFNIVAKIRLQEKYNTLTYVPEPMLWSDEVLKVPHAAIEQLSLRKTRFLALNFSHVVDPDKAHANVIFVDFSENSAERFEPAGSEVYTKKCKIPINLELLDEKMEPFFQVYNLSYISPKEQQSKGIQSLYETTDKNKGACSLWSTFYVDFRVKWTLQDQPANPSPRMTTCENDIIKHLNTILCTDGHVSEKRVTNFIRNEVDEQYGATFRSRYPEHQPLWPYMLFLWMESQNSKEIPIKEHGSYGVASVTSPLIAQFRDLESLLLREYSTNIGTIELGN